MTEMYFLTVLGDGKFRMKVLVDSSWWEPSFLLLKGRIVSHQDCNSSMMGFHASVFVFVFFPHRVCYHTKIMGPILKYKWGDVTAFPKTSKNNYFVGSKINVYSPRSARPRACATRPCVLTHSRHWPPHLDLTFPIVPPQWPPLPERDPSHHQILAWLTISRGFLLKWHLIREAFPAHPLWKTAAFVPQLLCYLPFLSDFFFSISLIASWHFIY